MGWLTRFRIHQLKWAQRINGKRLLKAFADGDLERFKRRGADNKNLQYRIDALATQEKQDD